MSTELPKQFEYQEAEGRIYALWEQEHVFHARVDRAKTPFCVVIPPPNVTGILHMGHVLDNVPQDIMTRWHRMRGFSALWVPGTDHAGIATQNVVERQLRKEGSSARDLGRDEFVRRVWEWREKHGSIIIQQLKRLGCSCDWSRERFTMDEQLSRAVVKAFITYYERGLIYKGTRMINWCPRCGTALANDEVNHQDRKSHLWFLRYPLIDAKDADGKDYIVVATTRPETMLGDTAVAVNPEDPRFKSLIGKQLMLPLQQRPIPIIADAFVDPQFGTGLVKVTPAHDPNDYQMGLTHKLPLEVVIGDDGRMTKAAGPYAGLDRVEARKRVVEDLTAADLVEKIDPYTHSVGSCYRCETVVEPFVSDQWFVRMKPLAEKAKQAVLDGRITIVPESERHDYFHWMDTIQDWCISRQLWWGHRIPVYYCDDCGEVMARAEAPKACGKCSSTKIRQDEDVLDTWFSSQLWPFSTLGWPEATEDFKYWYPNSWLMSGRDILFFWDARMIMAGLELIGDVPFRRLSLHGLARDEQGRKLSKSLGNSPDPLNLFDEYGTDAIRASIVQRYPMGRQDIKLNERVYQEGRAFVTKIWNAFRLIMMQLQEGGFAYDSARAAERRVEDRWILSRLGRTVALHDELLEQNDFAHSLEALSSFFWNEYCDWYLELIKPRLRAGGEEAREALCTALHCQRTMLKLLHPYVPFVTEELWQMLKQLGVRDEAAGEEPCLALSAWPVASDFTRDEAAEAALNVMMSLVRGARDVRHHLQLPPKQSLPVQVSFTDGPAAERFSQCRAAAQMIGGLDPLQDAAATGIPAGHVPCRFEGGIAYIQCPADLDITALRGRIEKKMGDLEKSIAGAERQLNNQAFMQSAPPAIVEETQRKAAEYAETRKKLEEFRASLAGMER